MAFRLPQQRDPNEAVRRFVNTALAVRQQDQNESFQIQKSLVDMEAQQKRKQMLDNAYGQSIQRVAKVLSTKGLTGNEVNTQIEGEASKFASAAPELYKALTAQKVKDSQHVLVDKEIDKKSGATIEKKYLLDEFSGVKKPLGEAMVVDQNIKSVKANEESGDTNTMFEVGVDPKGNIVYKTKTGVEPSAAKKAADADQRLPYDQRTSYRMLIENKGKQGKIATDAGQAKQKFLGAEASAVDGKFLYPPSATTGVLYTVGSPAAEALKKTFDVQIKRAQDQEQVYQKAIERMKRNAGEGGDAPAGRKGRYDVATGKIIYDK